MTLRRWLRAALAGLAASMVAGCWATMEPLLSAGNAAEVDFAAGYKPPKHDTVVKAIRNADGSYTLSDENDGFTSFFMHIGSHDDGEWYLIQQDFKPLFEQMRAQLEATGHAPSQKLPEREGPFGLQIVRVAPDSLTLFKPECDNATKAIDGVSVQADESGMGEACVFSDAATLQSAANAMADRLAAGKSQAKSHVLTAISGK